MKQKISYTLFYKHSVLVFSFFVGWGAVSEYAYDFSKGSSIKCVRKISRKTNISNPLIRTRTCAYQGARNVSIWKILRIYFMDGPFSRILCLEYA